MSDTIPTPTPLPNPSELLAPSMATSAEAVSPPTTPEPAGPPSGWRRWLGRPSQLNLSLLLVLVLGVVGWQVFHENKALTGSDNDSDEEHVKPIPIPVNTVCPRQKTLERTYEQPGTIEPLARAELYAKVSGVLREIHHVTTPDLAATMVGQELTARMGYLPGALGSVAQLSIMAAIALERAPQLDRGAFVHKGDLLLEIDVPERMQDVMEFESQLLQKRAELDYTQSNLKTYEAAVEVARAQKVQAEADVKRWESEYTFRNKELHRLEDLARSGTITREVVDEKQNQVEAARAAWVSSQAKVQVAQAELSLASSKFTAAQADLKVKQAAVEIARKALHRAEILADYCRIYAPFDGLVTYRGVDEGDFVQNATSGQTHHLLTVTALDRVRVVLQVPEQEALLVRVGAEATVWVDAQRSRRIKGKVARIDYTLEEQTRTMRVEIDLDNADHRLLPGMYGRVNLVLEKVTNAQAIPTTAIFSRKGEQYVMIVKEGVARRQPVRIRFDDGKEAEVVRLLDNQEVPLDGSEELVISNKGEIADGQTVRPTRLSPR